MSTRSKIMAVNYERRMFTIPLINVRFQFDENCLSININMRCTQRVKSTDVMMIINLRNRYDTLLRDICYYLWWSVISSQCIRMSWSHSLNCYYFYCILIKVRSAKHMMAMARTIFQIQNETFDSSCYLFSNIFHSFRFALYFCVDCQMSFPPFKGWPMV